MFRLKQVIYTVLFTCLVGNALLIVSSHLRNALEEPTLARRSLDELSCCKEWCKNLSHTSNIANYSKLANKMPQLDPAYHNLLVRLGTDLDFNVEHHCPSGSLMRNRSQNFSPKHLNCPTLFLVGARKGGTTSLYQYVSKHPDFEGTQLDAGPKVGETYYFSRYYDSKSWERYLSLFPPDGVMTGDASVGNLVSKLAPRRLYESCGKQAKVVMLFRDPITRLHSNFLMRARLKLTHIGNQTSISTVVKIHLDRFFGKVFERTMHVKDLPSEWEKLVGLFDPSTNFVYEGLYYVHLMNWLCNFPAENILIINSEEFFKNPTEILKIVYQFLELKQLDSETYRWITSATYNRGQRNIPDYQRLSYNNKMSLLGVYKPFNKALLELLQWENTGWTTTV